MEVKQYFNVIKRWWWLLIVGTIIPMSVSYHFLSQQPALYQAKVTLMVGTALVQPDITATDLRWSITLAQAYTMMVKRRPITQAVIEGLDLKMSPEELADQITAWFSREAPLLEIMVTDTNPQAAALIANTLAEELIRQSPVSLEAENRRRRFVEQQLADLETNIKNIEEEIRELEDSLPNQVSAIDLEDTRQKLDSLRAELAALRSTHALWYQAFISSSANVLTVVEQAVEPTWPVSSRSRLILLVAGAAGFALSLGAAFVIEFLDDTLRWESYKDRTLLDLPVVGLMPRLPQEDGHISTDIPLDSSKAEALRLLRADIFLTLAHRLASAILATSPGPREDRTSTIVASPISTILVTSPGRREGRTTIVASLGMVIASGGQRVIIVDADLRTPDLHEVFGLPNDYGLCELLLGHAPSLSKALQETSIPNLTLLASGRPPLDLALALTSPRLVELIEALRQQADIIIVDSPPVLLAPDTVILSGLFEGTLVAVRDSYTTLESVSRIKERLSAYGGAPIMGVLFSRARLGGWTLFPRRRPRLKPPISPPSTDEGGLEPLVDLASSALEAVASGRDDDLREFGPLLSQNLSNELEKEINRVWPEGQPMSAEDEELRDRIDMALETLRLIEQRFGGEAAEEWYPPLDQGVEAEPAEGLAVKSQATKGEDGAK